MSSVMGKPDLCVQISKQAPCFDGSDIVPDKTLCFFVFFWSKSIDSVPTSSYFFMETHFVGIH